MAADALEEKITKIRLQNEEIKRRYEEVEADKKNAAKLNALVQMVPSSDWPERKEPPEFTRKETNKSNAKPKSIKEHSERPQQYLIGAVEGKKIHKFAQGDGPPPDPKYNFLADSEREENNVDNKKDEDKHKAPNKYVRNGPRKRGGGRDGYQKDHRKVPTTSRDGYLPEYDAWRAERNRIDEARINRQRTAEGNWRREWDNDKVNMEKESSKKDPRFSLGDSSRRDYKEYEKRHQFEVEASNRNRGGNHRGSHGPRTHAHYDNQHYDHQNDFSESLIKGPLSPNDDRTVIATDKSIKVTLNHSNLPIKGPVMSVKVNAPSIAGTGRVGPRQKSRVTYSSHGETEISTHQIDNFYRQKSFDEKTHFNNTQRTNPPKSPFSMRKKENNKSPYLQRKDVKRDEQSMRGHGDNIAKSPSAQKKKFKEQQKSPQGQMQFFTSASRGRGQKRLNGANNTVIKILGHTDRNEPLNLNSESTNFNFTNVTIPILAKSNEFDSKQFSLDINETENLKNQCENNENQQIIDDNFTIIEAENSNQDTLMAVNDSIVSIDLQNETLEEKFTKNEELVTSEETIDLQNETLEEKFTKNEEIVKKIDETEKNEEIIKREFEKNKEMTKNEESQENLVLKEIQVLEKTEDLKKSEKLENKESEENKKSEENKVLKEIQVLEESEILEKDEILSRTNQVFIKNELEKSDEENTKTEDTTIEEIKTEIEKINQEEKKLEEIKTEEKEIEKIEPKEKQIENIEFKEKEIEEKPEKNEEKIEPVNTKIETIEPKMEKTEPDEKVIEKIESEKSEVSQETPKNEENSEIEHGITIVENIDEKLSENISNIEESILTGNNIFSKIENFNIDSNETKVEDDEQVTLKKEIIESVREITEELETKSLETVSTEIPNEASCVPSE